MALNTNKLHIPTPSPEEGDAYMSLWIAYCIYSNKQPVSSCTCGSRCTESGTKQCDVTELVPCWPVIGVDQWSEPCDRGTKRMSEVVRISQLIKYVRIAVR